MLVGLAKVILIPLLVLNLIPLLVWMERKGAAYFQDRRGPNRAAILGIRLGGMVHNLADVIKMLTKEWFIPSGANRFYYFLAPLLILFVYIATVAVIPFAEGLQVADLNVGVLYIFAMASLAVYGILLAGWASGSKYPLLGGLRASSQMISYEIALGLSVVTLFMAAGTVDPQEIVRLQSEDPLGWNILRHPLALLLFTVASFAETNRTPFDLPEGESELVGGYHTEYSGIRFGMFFMAEYAAMLVSSMLLVTLFLGGWQVPFLSTEALRVGAPFLLEVSGYALSGLLILIGLRLVIRFRPHRYGDARDYEVLLLGVPSLLAGGALGAWLVGTGLGPLAEWVPAVFAAAAQGTLFLMKTLAVCFFFIWVRWTLPRFRYDQLMGLGWKGMIPLALANIFLTAGVLLVWG